MAHYVMLANFTDQGARNIKESPQRAEALKAFGERNGVELRDLFWTFGQTDIIIAIVEAKDDVAMTGLTMAISQMGNVKVQTLRAYDVDEVRKIIATMP
jgi:uncharacterized protein with GYD domain